MTIRQKAFDLLRVLDETRAVQIVQSQIARADSDVLRDAVLDLKVALFSDPSDGEGCAGMPPATDEEYLRSHGWTEDRGMWIFRGETFAAFTLSAAVKRQRQDDAVQVERARIERELARLAEGWEGEETEEQATVRKYGATG